MNLKAVELMAAIRFFCHSAWGYKEITCDSGTSVGFAAKRAAAAFFLDDNLAWILSEKIPGGRVLDNDDLIDPFADKQLFLSPGRRSP